MAFGKKDSGDSRFVPTSKIPTGTQTHVLVDTETGVNYLMVYFSSSVSVTPLLDENGNVIVTK